MIAMIAVLAMIAMRDVECESLDPFNCVDVER